MRLWATAIVACWAIPGAAETVRELPKPHVGDAYEIIMSRGSAGQGPGASSSSSNDQDAIVERVVAVREDGVELAVALADTSAGDRASQWQLPARFFKPFDGAPRLLNRAELESRVDPWLKSGGMSRAACGRLIFTWNAFRIECDPESAVKVLAAFDLQPPDLRDGAMFVDPEAEAATRLMRTASGPTGTTFTAEMTVDPDAIRRERARTDVGVGELTGKPLSLDAALRARAGETVRGTITVTFEANSAGEVRRRKKLVRYTVTSTAKGSETHMITQTLERRALPKV